MNTATMKHYIDFAADSKLEYMLIDAGWAAPGRRQPARRHHQADSGHRHAGDPALRQIQERGRVAVGALDFGRSWQMEQAFALFEKWGIAGVKIDFMNRDDQWMVDFYHRVAKTAAAHHLMIDFHGAYKPDGMSRTWPNVITREAVMGLEYSKWSARITPDHDVMLAFTRMLAGPDGLHAGRLR